MNSLTQQLDDLFHTAFSIREHTLSFHSALQELCGQTVLRLNHYPIERELEEARRNLLAWFRKNVETTLSEGRQIKFPADFFEKALENENAHQEESIWTRWDAAKILAFRNLLFPDLQEAEWQQSLLIAARTIGTALQRHDTKRPDRWTRRPDKNDELQTWCSLYEKDTFNPAVLRTSYRLDVENLHRTLQVIEGISDGSRYLAHVAIPLVLNPASGSKFEPRSIYRWHDTNIVGIPRVRVMADHALIFKFASPELLQRTKDALLPLIKF
jgi:hypothetical protein